MSKAIPGPKGLPLVGVAHQLRLNPLRLLQQCALHYGAITKLPVLHRKAFLLADPELIKSAFVIHQKSIQRQDMFEKVQKVLGKGLLTNDGTSWKKNRLLIQPLFGPSSMQFFVEIMNEEAKSIVERWTRDFEPEQKSVDVGEEMMTLTLNIIFRCLLSEPYKEPESRAAFLELNKIVGKRLWSFVPGMDFLPSKDNLDFLRYRSQLFTLMQTKISERIKSDQKIEDFLGLLLSARSESEGQAFTNRQIQDELLTFAFAGHETTAIALTWVFVYLSKRPDLLAEMRQEAKIFLENESVNLEDLGKLTVIQAVFMETLRLRPPAWFMPRTALETVDLEGYTIPSGSLVIVSPFVMHHLPHFWQDPDEFKPERFFDAKKTLAEKRYIYFPFAAGPHTCIGSQFAIFEAIIALAHIVDHFEFENQDRGYVPLDPAVTLRQGIPVRIRLKKRQKHTQAA